MDLLIIIIIIICVTNAKKNGVGSKAKKEGLVYQSTPQPRVVKNQEKKAAPEKAAPAKAVKSDSAKAVKADLGNAMGTKEKRGRATLASNDMMIEDRNNDWLARQLKEEARIKRNSLDLGGAHGQNCEAGEIKENHARNHSRNR